MKFLKGLCIFWLIAAIWALFAAKDWGGRLAGLFLILIIATPYCIYRYNKTHKKFGRYQFVPLLRPWVLPTWIKLWGYGLRISTPIRFAGMFVFLGTVCVTALVRQILPAQCGWMLYPITWAVLFLLYRLTFDRPGNRKKYEDTEYYKQTKRPLKEIQQDKGLWGEFLAYLQFDRLDCYKRFIFNAVIPKEDGDGFTEIDMICITQTWVFVVEVKNRTGAIKGRILEMDWEQEAGNQKNPMQNPFIQNQNHIISLHSYLEQWAMASMLGKASNRGDIPEELITGKLTRQYMNTVFLGNYNSWLDMEGELSDRMTWLWPDSLSDPKIKNRLEDPNNFTFSREEVDALADVLLPTTQFSPSDRECMFQMREHLSQMEQGRPAYYFVEVEPCNGVFYCELYRYDTHGIARYDDGFWNPVGVNIIYQSSWADRLSKCGMGGRDVTSLPKAREAKSILDRHFHYQPNIDMLERCVENGTLRDYLEKQVVRSGCPIYVLDRG